MKRLIVGISGASGAIYGIRMLEMLRLSAGKTLSGIVHSSADSLLVRAALPGAVIAPPMPAFYSQPQTIDDLINHIVGRVLDLLDLDASIL